MGARTNKERFLGRLGVGAGEAALSPATYSLISAIFPREKLGRAVAVYSYSTGPFLGAGVIFLIGGSVIALAAALPQQIFFGQEVRPWQLVVDGVGMPGLLLTRDAKAA